MLKIGSTPFQRFTPQLNTITNTFYFIFRVQDMEALREKIRSRDESLYLFHIFQKYSRSIKVSTILDRHPLKLAFLFSPLSDFPTGNRTSF